MKSCFRSIVLSLSLAAMTAVAAPDPAPGSSAPSDPVMEKGMPLVERKDWAGAAAVFRDAVARDPASAAYHNMYAYSLRNMPKPAMDLVFRHYNEALRIDPKHRGAHEYLGEAYLMTGNLAKAKEHLAALDRICTFGCDEYTMLKKAVAAHEARKK